jgi:hypothetical protein
MPKPRMSLKQFIREDEMNGLVALKGLKRNAYRIFNTARF